MSVVLIIVDHTKQNCSRSLNVFEVIVNAPWLNELRTLLNVFTQANSRKKFKALLPSKCALHKNMSQFKKLVMLQKMCFNW